VIGFLQSSRFPAMVGTIGVEGTLFFLALLLDLFFSSNDQDGQDHDSQGSYTGDRNNGRLDGSDRGLGARTDTACIIIIANTIIVITIDRVGGHGGAGYRRPISAEGRR